MSRFTTLIVLILAATTVQGTTIHVPSEQSATLTETSSDDDVYWMDYFGELYLDDVASATAEYNGELIVAGKFPTVGGKLAAHIAAWDGERVTPLGSGTDDNVYALAEYQGLLIAGGR